MRECVRIITACEAFTINDLMDLHFDEFLIVRDEVERILTKRNSEMKKATRKRR